MAYNSNQKRAANGRWVAGKGTHHGKGITLDRRRDMTKAQQVAAAVKAGVTLSHWRHVAEAAATAFYAVRKAGRGKLTMRSDFGALYRDLRSAEPVGLSLTGSARLAAQTVGMDGLVAVGVCTAALFLIAPPQAHAQQPTVVSDPPGAVSSTPPAATGTNAPIVEPQPDLNDSGISAPGGDPNFGKTPKPEPQAQLDPQEGAVAKQRGGKTPVSAENKHHMHLYACADKTAHPYTARRDLLVQGGGSVDAGEVRCLSAKDRAADNAADWKRERQFTLRRR